MRQCVAYASRAATKTHTLPLSIKVYAAKAMRSIKSEKNVGVTRQDHYTDGWQGQQA